MPKKTLQQKLTKQLLKAENCLNREEAQKILKKVAKLRAKLSKRFTK
jgi:hypothetical protein